MRRKLPVLLAGSPRRHGPALHRAVLAETIERVDITLPRRVLKQLDALARAAGESRSGYIAQLTLEEPRRVA